MKCWNKGVKVIAVLACVAVLSGVAVLGQDLLPNVESDGRIAWVIGQEGNACVVGLDHVGWNRGRVSAVGADGKEKVLLEFGWEVEDGETGAPGLVAMPDANTLVINGICPPTFPKKPDNDREAETGNVLLFKLDARTFVNLTRMDGAKDSYAEAVVYIPEEKVIVVRVSKLVQDTNLPTPAEGGAQSLFLNLNGEKVAAGTCPRAAAAYAEYMKLRPVEVKIGENKGWCISIGSQSLLGGTRLAQKPAVHYLSPGLWSISGEDLGTFLAKPADGMLVKISQKEIVGYAPRGGGELLLREVGKNKTASFSRVSVRSLMDGMRDKLAGPLPSNP
jgi:hypothetical protein